jgi:hypothetical protein
VILKAKKMPVKRTAKGKLTEMAHQEELFFTTSSQAQTRPGNFYFVVPAC